MREDYTHIFNGQADDFRFGDFDMFEKYQQTLFDVAMEKAYNIWDSPVQSKSISNGVKDLIFTFAKGISLRVQIGLLGKFCSAEDTVDNPDVIDLYSDDKEYWEP